jgi:hypothetical protein
MYDPMTVAFDIKSPFRGEPSKMWPKGYRNTLVTIWHVDPEDRRGMCVRRGDDTCGWFTPPYSPEAKTRIEKLGKQQYSTIFERQVREREGATYARICFVPTPYDAVYWSWRSIKHEFRRTGPWQYDANLSRGEMEAIYRLSANPVDNVRSTIDGVVDEESFISFFTIVYHAYLRHHRPWWQHPRWHVWHWRLQVHPWQTFRRWAFSRCAGCGKGFSWGYSPVSHGWDSKRPKLFCSEEGVYHSECSGMTMKLNREPAAGTA